MAREHVESVRRFNRFYTRQIGLLERGFLHSPFSLTDVRVLYEIANRDEPSAAELCSELGIDPGYLSRILRSFARRRLIRREASGDDARRRLISLTPAGRGAFEELDARSHGEIAALLERLSTEEKESLVRSMNAIERLLGASVEEKAKYLVRSHRPGDMGWVVARHGALYAREYGWDATFEALVAGIVASFIRTLDPGRERCWIAERNGENVGCVFLVKKSRTVAQLRLLLVEPGARGLGIGARLVDECVRFARKNGYRKIVLWTNSVLDAARHIYEKNGFRLVEENRHRSFGHDLVGQNWELAL